MRQEEKVLTIMCQDKTRRQPKKDNRGVQMKPGDRIIWSYRHSLGRHYTIVTKHGVYHGKIKHTVRYKGNNQLALVSFDNNKRASKVPFARLEMEKEA